MGQPSAGAAKGVGRGRKMSLTPRQSRRPSTVNFRVDEFPDELVVPPPGWSRRSSAVQVRDDGLAGKLTVSQPGWSRRPSAVEVVNDGLSGQLMVPIYDDQRSGSDGLPTVPHSDDEKPAATIQGVALFPGAGHDLDEDTETETEEGSEEDVMDGTYVCRVTSILSRLGVGADLATIWRIPFMTRKYGVSFLCVYLLLTLVVGLPTYYMEFALGQFSSRSAIQMWKFAPIFAGFGYAMVLLSFLIAVYGSAVVAWSLLYLFSSMNKQVPWRTCNSVWNIANCTEVYRDKIVFYANPNDNGTVIRDTWSTHGPSSSDGTSRVTSGVIHLVKTTVSTEAFFWFDVADRAPASSAVDYHNWRLILCLLVIWCVIGFTFTRKVSYRSKVLNVVSALLMGFFVLMIIIGVLAVDDGAYRGLNYLFSMPWTDLGRSEIWLDAFGQMVLSYGICSASVVCYGSRHRFRHNTRRDVIIVFGVKLVSAVVVTLTTFIVLGFLAERLSLEVNQVVKCGPELLFVVASQAILLLPRPPIWAALFFFLLAVMGHRYLCFWVEPVLRAPLEVRFHLWRGKRLLVVVGACLLMLAAGLALVGSHGLYLMSALDRHLLTWTPLVSGAVECVALCWVYGVDKWAANVEVMLGDRPSRWWTTTWKFVVPMVSAALLLFGLINYTVPEYESLPLPLWVTLVAGLVGMTPLVVAFLMLSLHALRSRRMGQGSLWRPDAGWGPVKEQHRWQTYGVTFVAPEPILMVHVDSILKPELYGGIPHGYYLHRDAKGAEAADVLRQQDELRRVLQRRLMMQKQLASVSKKVVINDCRSSESGSDSTISSVGSSTGEPLPADGRRKSILVQAAALRKRLETSFSRPGSDGQPLPEHAVPRRHSCTSAPGAWPGDRAAGAGAASADPSVPLDPARLLTVREETGSENLGYQSL